jgi:hypothetical protein
MSKPSAVLSPTGSPFAVAASVGLPIAWQLLGVSVVLILAMCLATTRYILDTGLQPSSGTVLREELIFDEPQAVASDHSPNGQLRRQTLEPIEILLGIMRFATAIGEGAASDWLALMLVDNRAAPAAVGALTYAGFNITGLRARLPSIDTAEHSCDRALLAIAVLVLLIAVFAAGASGAQR